MNDQEFVVRIAYERARLQTVCASDGPDQRADAMVRQRDLAKQVDEMSATCPLRPFCLTDTEARLFWFVVAHRTDTEVARLVEQLSVSLVAGLSSSVVRELVYGERWSVAALRELSASCRLARLGLLERQGDPLDELHDRWSVPNRVIAWLKGDRRTWAPVQDVAAVAATETPYLAVSDEVVCSIRRALVGARRSTILISGAQGLGRTTLVTALAAAEAVSLLRVDATTLAKEPVELAKQLRLIARECKLLARVPLIRNIDALVDNRDQTRIDLVGSELVAELDTNVLVTCGVDRPQLRWDRPVIAIEVKPPTSAQRARLWRELLSDASEEDAEYLATQYPLAPAVMHQAAQAALARAAGKPVTPEDIVEGIRAVLDDKLGNFAKRVEVTQAWEDLVIDEAQAQAITEMIARIRQRRTVYEQWGFAAKVGKGLGVSALFSGPPGTGKTMVAALIAKELGLELYQVDMAKLVSKWIGETEKQLGEMFDAAEAGHAILLFDEADSLFGKRTEVRSSNDRYANLETNYLLQRLESFTGICLLTTNHESSIDPAFQRRLSLHLRFNVPDEDEREKLWRAMLPAQAPVAANVDFAGLAKRFAMTGGYIKNAALRAAFLAADERTAIAEHHLEYAARLEYEGMGKIAMPAWPAKVSASL